MHLGLRLFQTMKVGANRSLSLWYNIDMQRLGQKKGFTLVELSLSIAFIAILSITVALIINDAISTYRRGVTLNQVNTEGMDLVDDMRAAVQNSPAGSIVGECEFIYGGSNTDRNNCKSTGARNFVVVKRVGVVNDEISGAPLYGAFCTGAYSYIWNSGYFYSESSDIDSSIEPVSLVYSGGTIDNFRLIKIKDQRRAVCISAVKNAGGYNGEINSVFDISEYGDLSDEPEVLLSNDSSQPLALYDLDAAVPATNDLGNATYYSVSFILGTVQGGINVMSTGNFCKTPGEYDENFDYCAINKFNFAVQAIGG